jgi:ATP-dependent Lon protease
MVNNYCAHEAGVRNLRKCIDRIFRKVVAKIESKKIAQSELDSHLNKDPHVNEINVLE